MLNVAESSIEWLLDQRVVPQRKIAGRIRFTWFGLEALIEAGAVTECCATVEKSEV